MGTGSSTFRESGGHYETFSHYGQYNGTNALESYDYNNSTIAFANNVSFDAGTGVSGFVNIYGALDSSVHTNSSYSLSFVKNTSYTISIQGAGTNLAQLDDAYIKCTYSSGNIASGTIALYGVKDA